MGGRNGGGRVGQLGKKRAVTPGIYRMCFLGLSQARTLGTGVGRVAWVVGGLVWGIGWRRLGCVCGRRLGTGSCVSVRQTTHLVVRGLVVRFSVCLSAGRM